MFVSWVRVKLEYFGIWNIVGVGYISSVNSNVEVSNWEEFICFVFYYEGEMVCYLVIIGIYVCYIIGIYRCLVESIVYV